MRSIPTVHVNNIFFAKDLPGQTEMDYIVSCAADGRVVMTNIHTNTGYCTYMHRLLRPLQIR